MPLEPPRETVRGGRFQRDPLSRRSGRSGTILSPRERLPNVKAASRFAKTWSVPLHLRIIVRDPSPQFPPLAAAAHRLLSGAAWPMQSQSSHSRPPSGSRYWIDGFPELVVEWDFGRNGDLKPTDLSAGSGRRVWWTCSRGPDHRWRAKPNNRTRGTGCPFCANRRVSVTNSLATRFPEMAAEWHAERNGALSPTGVVATTSRMAWWCCRRDEEHVWRASVRARVRDQSSCPFCSNDRVCARALRGAGPAEGQLPGVGARLRPRQFPEGRDRAGQDPQPHRRDRPEPAGGGAVLSGDLLGLDDPGAGQEQVPRHRRRRQRHPGLLQDPGPVAQHDQDQRLRQLPPARQLRDPQHSRKRSGTSIPRSRPGRAAFSPAPPAATWRASWRRC